MTNGYGENRLRGWLVLGLLVSFASILLLLGCGVTAGEPEANNFYAGTRSTVFKFSYC
jgi:formate hydrogenlyase subunit 3/multisubunit Na+/H+ antiporter MnhD subunit